MALVIKVRDCGHTSKQARIKQKVIKMKNKKNQEPKTQ